MNLKGGIFAEKFLLNLITKMTKSTLVAGRIDVTATAEYDEEKLKVLG
jgi:hypothetical protein